VLAAIRPTTDWPKVSVIVRVSDEWVPPPLATTLQNPTGLACASSRPVAAEVTTTNVMSKAIRTNVEKRIDRLTMLIADITM
jgi:hypothetical protein